MTLLSILLLAALNTSLHPLFYQSCPHIVISLSFNVFISAWISYGRYEDMNIYIPFLTL